MFTPVTRSVRNGRSPRVLAAALAVAMPGLLVSACSSQSGPGQPGGDAVSAAGRAAAGPVIRSRAPAAAKRPTTVRAVKLLAQAAQAAIVTSYQGKEILTRWSQGGGSVLVSSIWHVSGGQTVTQTTADGASFSSQSYLSSDTDGQSPEGVLGVTAPLVRLLKSHYLVAYAGTGSADNRTAQVVEAWRADGSIAARFWLDDATKLPLEREVFDTAAHVIGQDVFIDVSFTARGARGIGSAPGDSRPRERRRSRPPPRRPAPGSRPTRRGPGPIRSPAASCSPCATAAGRSRPSCPAACRCSPGPRRRRIPVPCSTSATRTACPWCRCSSSAGSSRPALAGWRKTKAGGHVVFALPDQRTLTWAGHGMVFTMVADAPSQTVDAVVGALPHDGPTGFWKRMSRGLVRVASWVNPFH